MILQGNCLQVLPTLDAQSVQMCVTSPPYYGLRDYGTARWIGGTDENCDHKQIRGGNGNTSQKQTTSEGTQDYQYKDVCKKCGALRIDDQIGLEETPEAYVEKLVAVFREVRRVLKDDGTLWLNLGDSYAGGKQGRGDTGDGYLREGRTPAGEAKQRPVPMGYKQKDLLGIPWMVAFALRADGWYLRSDIIWHKPNPMPESVTDRPTKAHEYIFLLSKSKDYYYDYEAILEPSADPEGSASRYKYKFSGRPNVKITPNDETGQRYAPQGFREIPTHKNLLPDGQQPNSMHLRRAEGLPDTEYPARNKRTVWTVTTKPYSGAHFATFPPDLIEPCILAGSRVGDVVLDPFNGSGTTGSVAIKHHRDYLGIELNPEYIKLSEKRLLQTQPVLFPAT